VFYGQRFTKADFSTDNLLARAVWYLLQSRGLKGFYFPAHEGAYNVVKERLQTQSKATLTFVQLVQSATFDWRNENYCHFEYTEAAASASCKKAFFVLGDQREELKLEWSKVVSGGCRDWYLKSVEDKDGLELRSTNTRDSVAITENRKKIERLVAGEVIRIRNELFEGVPA
jgi:hypothetical protein